jgi:hypothetical protein
MHEARGRGSEIVSYCGLKLWELQAIQIIGFLKIGSGVRDCQRWDREHGMSKGSVEPNPPPSLLAGPQWVMPDPEAGASDSGPLQAIARYVALILRSALARVSKDGSMR